MNTPTILCFAVLIISNIALWELFILQQWWKYKVDEQLDSLFELDKTLYEVIKSHKNEHKMKLNSMYDKYANTDSVKEDENNDN